MKKKLFLAVMFVVPLLVASCSSVQDDADAVGSAGAVGRQSERSPSSDSSGAPSSPDGHGTSPSGSQLPSEPDDAGPDLADIPDVVAEVDGHKIRKPQFIQAYQAQYQEMMFQAQQSGQQPDQDKIKKQVADGLVGRQLLLDEADHRGLTASDKQIDDELADLAEQNRMDSVDDLMDALAGQGTDETEIRDQVRAQVKVEQLITDEVGDTTPSEKEVRQYYDDAVAQQGDGSGEGAGADAPAFDDIKAQIEQQLKGQNENEAAQKLVDHLRQDADVTVNL